MKKLGYIFILIGFLANAGNPPSIIFKENKGQWPEKVLFGTEFLNTNFYVNKTGFTYCVYDWKDLKASNEFIHSIGEEHKKPSPTIHGHNYEVVFENADLSNVSKNDIQSEYYNYFLGNRKNRWASSVHAYADLLFNSIYYNTDLKLYSTGTGLKYDVIIRPGGNSGVVKMNYKYVNDLIIENEILKIRTSVGDIIEQKPIAYQIINGQQKFIKCKYVMINERTVGFLLPEDYDHTHNLIIDPTVVVCSYSGFTGHGACSAASGDASGNIFVAGYCRENYPTSTGAFSSNYYGVYDVVISKYNSTGSIKQFATYLGGDSLDFPNELIISDKEITVYGTTNSDNFPYSSNAFDSTRNWATDLFISKLDLTGTVLEASTYLGGSKNDGWYIAGPNIGNYDHQRNLEIVLDRSGNVFGIANTISPDFPTTTGVVSNTLGGPMDGCAFKFDSTLSNLVWSTYIGGSRDESIKSIRLDGVGGVFLCGTTTSTNFPTTTGVISQTKNGANLVSDMFVMHLDANGNSIASTFIGTNTADYANLMDIDLNGDIYICGYIATSASLTPTPGLYSNPGGNNTIYKINPTLTNIIFKTKFGNGVPPTFPQPSPWLYHTAFKVDSCQNIYIAGYAENVLPVTANQIMPFAGGRTDIYVALFNSNCSSLKFASFWGGNKSAYSTGEHCDAGINHIDSRGNLYQALCTNGGLPVTPNAYSQTLPAFPGDTLWNDAFVKIDLETFVNANSSYGANIVGCPPFTPTFVSTTNLGTTYWDLGNGVTSTKDTISTTYTTLGNYNVLLVVTDTNTCNRYDSIKSVLSVISPTEFDLGEDLSSCINSRVLIKSNVAAMSYSWSSGQTTQNIFAYPGSYTLTINNGGCNTSDSIHVVVGEKKLSERFPNVVTPNADGVNDFIELKKYNFAEVELVIYDRWGREVFRSDDPKAEWHPDNLNPGTYFYTANYLSECIGKYATDKGFISIFK